MSGNRTNRQLRIALVAGSQELHQRLVRALSKPPSLLEGGYVFASLSDQEVARPDIVADFDLILLALPALLSVELIEILRATTAGRRVIALALAPIEQEQHSALANQQIPLVPYPLDEQLLREVTASLLAK